MKIVAISDTHGMHGNITIPDGDLLIHAGDFCSHGTMQNLEEFCLWLKVLPHKHKIVVAGNHDRIAQENFAFTNDVIDSSGAIYLEDDLAVINGIKIYGSPWTPRFMDWYFMANRGADIAKKWAKISSDTDMLVTHGPPYGIMDKVNHLSQGCEDLLNRIKELDLLVHIFGHIHEGYGCRQMPFSPIMVNASICNDNYKPINEPIVFEI